jgi:hypothetical protein
MPQRMRQEPRRTGGNPSRHDPGYGRYDGPCRRFRGVATRLRFRNVAS